MPLLPLLSAFVLPLSELILSHSSGLTSNIFKRTSERFGTKETELPSADASVVKSISFEDELALLSSGNEDDKKQSLMVLRRSSLLGCDGLSVLASKPATSYFEGLKFCFKEVSIVDDFCEALCVLSLAKMFAGNKAVGVGDDGPKICACVGVETDELMSLSTEKSDTPGGGGDGVTL